MHRREIIFGLLLAAVFLLAAGFFFFTSSFFLTHLLVPWVARASGCPMSAERAEFRPFSQRLILYNFRLGRADKPFLTVRRARGTAQFSKLVCGIIDFDDVELSGAELNICRDASGRWCSYELGLTVDENESVGDSSESRPVQVRLARSRVEDSRINVAVRDQQRDFTWSFTGISGEVDDFRNGGALMIKCVSPFLVKGREGIDFSGKVEWNGELLLDEQLCFAGMKGGFIFDSFAGNIDRHNIGGSEVRCALDLGMDDDGKWIFRNFRLTQQKWQQVRSLVEFEGSLPDDSGKFRLDFRRFMLSGPFLSLLMDMGCGVRPGSMQVDGLGRITGETGCFSADLVCYAGRKAGPAYFGSEKVDLPDFQLKTEQNINFDLRSGKVDFRNARVQISSGGRQILDVNKNPADGSVKAGIDKFDMKLLQLLIPDAQRFKISGGQVSGEIFLMPGSTDDAVSCRTDLHFSGVGFSSGALDTGFFDASASGAFTVPRSGHTVKVESLHLDAGRQGQSLVKAFASGSISRRGTDGDLNWKISGDPLALLPMLQSPAMTDVVKISELFAPVRFESLGRLKFVPGGISVQDTRMQLHGREQSSAVIELENCEWKWAVAETAGWKIHWRTAFPASLIPPMPWASFSGGCCTGEGSVNMPGRGAGFSISGEVNWQNLTGILYGKSFNRLGGGMDFSLIRNRDGVYNLNRSVVYCRVGSKPALRLEGVGSGDTATGTFLADMQVRYLNEHFVNILLPGRFRTGQLSGRSVISGDYRNQKWGVNGYFSVDNLQTFGATRPVNGNLQYEFTRDGEACKIPSCKLILNSGDKVLADLSMAVDMPADAAAPVMVRFSGAPVDLSSLYAQIGTSGTGVPRDSTSGPGRVVLDTGTRPAEVHLDLQNMSWGAGQNFALRGKLFLRKNRITAQNMVLDGGQGQIVWGLDGLDYPDGMVLTSNAKVTKPFAIGPFTALFFPESGLDGIVESGECCLNFRRLFSAHWGEDLVGSCKLKLKDVELPVNAANGPLSRLLLLPVETIVRAEQLIPATWDVREHFKTLWRYKLSAESPFSRLKFYSGDLLIAAAKGDLMVKRMTFTGEPLSQMQVVGKMRLVDPYELEFDSRVLLCGVQAKLPVRGVLQSPRVAAWQVFANLPGSAFSGWMDIFTPFQEDGKSAGIPFISPFMRLLRDFSGFRE